MGTPAGVLPRFHVKDIKPGIPHHAAHLVDGPGIGLSNGMLERLGWRTVEKSNQQAPLRTKYGGAVRRPRCVRTADFLVSHAPSVGTVPLPLVFVRELVMLQHGGTWVTVQVRQ